MPIVLYIVTEIKGLAVPETIVRTVRVIEGEIEVNCLLRV